MDFFKKETSINFMAIRKKAIVFSCIVSFISIFSFFYFGLHLSLDFTGGTQIRLNNIKEETTVVRDWSVQKFGNDVTVQELGTQGDILVRIGGINNIKQQENMAKVFKSHFGSDHFYSITYIGPQIGDTLLFNGIVATLIALLTTMVYVMVRFEFRFGLSAMLALLHDPIVILGCFALFQLEFDINALAAILTVLGYSLNDTIVVYDRVKENFIRHKSFTPDQCVNSAINQTLSRTIMTSGLTLLVVLSLLFFGGDQLHNFALALTIGIIIGTYSSIYIAGSVAVVLGLNRESLLPKSRDYLKLIP